MVLPWIDPVAIRIGPISVHWYAISYIIGILGCLYYVQRISAKYSLGITKKDLDSYFTYLVFGIILGGRLGYVLFYDPIRYFEDPIEIFKTLNGGMSFHGGFVGVIIASYIFCKKHKVEFFKLMDLAAVVTPFALFWGRIGNFINGELYGRVTDVDWAMVFPESDGQPRHPSQLYEAFLEGIVLLIIMYFASKKIKQTNYTTGVFLIFYSLFRILCEFFREPDFHIGFVVSTFSMGQLLSLPTLFLGIYFMVKSSCQLHRK